MTSMTTAKEYMLVETLIVLDPELLLPLFPGGHAARPPLRHESESAPPQTRRAACTHISMVKSPQARGLFDR